MANRATGRRANLLVFAVALAVLTGAALELGVGLDGDGTCYLLWGRELAGGETLNRANPSFTTPKLFPIVLAGIGSLLPGARTAEWFLVICTAVLGAGVVTLTAYLASRLGGRLAGFLAVPLLLLHMQVLQYVINAQSTIHAAFFILAALLLAVREKAGPRDYVLAAVLVFVAGLARPESATAGGALALAALLRFGRRGIGWAVLVGAIGVASVPCNLLFHHLAFGSYRYNVDLVLGEMVYMRKALPSLHVGFAASLVKTVFHYANRLWLMLLLAAIGLGLLAGKEERRRYASLVLFPLATAAGVWLMLARGYLFNERCFFYVAFIIISLASAAVARMAAWASDSGEFLATCPRACRTGAFGALIVLAMLPVYLSRPRPRDGRQYASVRRAAEFVAKHIETPAPRLLASNEAGYFFYYLGLHPDKHLVHAIKRVRDLDEPLADDVRWYVVNEADLDWMLLDQWGVETEKEFERKLQDTWGMVCVWVDEEGGSRVFHRGPLEE